MQFLVVNMKTKLDPNKLSALTTMENSSPKGNPQPPMETSHRDLVKKGGGGGVATIYRNIEGWGRRDR